MLGKKDETKVDEKKVDEAAPAPAPVKKGDPKPIDEKKIAQQSDDTCEQCYSVGQEVKVNILGVKEEFKHKFVIKEVRGAEIVLARKDFK